MDFLPFLKSCQSMIEGRFANFETAIPAIIKKVNGDRIDVLPAVKGYTKNGVVADFENFAILGVPLLKIGTENFSISVAAKEGDKVLLIYSSRCLNGLKKNGWGKKPCDPNGISSNDANNCFAIQVCTNEAANKIEVKEDGEINVHTKKAITINGFLEIAGEE